MNKKVLHYYLNLHTNVPVIICLLRFPKCLISCEILCAGGWSTAGGHTTYVLEYERSFRTHLIKSWLEFNILYIIYYKEMSLYFLIKRWVVLDKVLKRFSRREFLESKLVGFQADKIRSVLSGDMFNPNEDGWGRICPRPVWMLIALKKLYCEKFEKSIYSSIRIFSFTHIHTYTHTS